MIHPQPPIAIDDQPYCTRTQLASYALRFTSLPWHLAVLYMLYLNLCKSTKHKALHPSIQTNALGIDSQFGLVLIDIFFLLCKSTSPQYLNILMFNEVLMSIQISSKLSPSSYPWVINYWKYHQIVFHFVVLNVGICKVDLEPVLSPTQINKLICIMYHDTAIHVPLSVFCLMYFSKMETNNI